MKIYTKTGDGGQTSLYGGERRPKDDLRIAAYGEVDELQAALGVALAANLADDLAEVLKEVQYDCFVLCSQLANPASGVKPTDPLIGEGRISWLESSIDRYDAEVPPLRTFIMQGGASTGATLHLARAICRRAERSLVALAREEGVDPLCLKYLNRLSDLLFVAARVANHRAGQPEIAWRWPRS